MIIDEQSHSKIFIESHTDDIGSETYNLDLSTKRANSVAQWMGQKGIAETSIEVKGYWESKPRVPNTTVSNRAKNRRVEITILR